VIETAPMRQIYKTAIANPSPLTILFDAEGEVTTEQQAVTVGFELEGTQVVLPPSS
jgi:hypothetical protein